MTPWRWCWMIGAVLASPLTAQDSVRIGDTVTVRYVVRAEGRQQVIVRGPNDYRRILDTLKTVIGIPRPVPPPVPPRDTLPSAGVLFASDWSSGDPMDGGKWNLRIGNGRLNRVVPVGDSLGFPSRNVLMVVGGWRGSPAGAAAENQRTDRLPDLAIGASRYYRWYIRVLVPDRYTGDTQTHPIQDATNGGGTNWMFQVIADQPGTWAASWSVRGAWPNNRFICTERLKRHHTYRIEARITRASTMTLSARLYDGERLVCDDAGFQNVNRSGSLAQTPALGIHDATQFRALQVGFNGLNGGVQGDYPVPLYYQGSVCIRSDTWCGR